MTLGRTSSGAIKIKTDEAGGGLRAVECACCGDCDLCGAVIASPPLLNLIKNATTVTVAYDFPGDSTYYIPQVSGTDTLLWNGESAYSNTASVTIAFTLVGDCFYFLIHEGIGADRLVQFYTPSQNCPFREMPDHTFANHVFFTIPVNEYNINAWQSYGYHQPPTISISFS